MAASHEELAKGFVEFYYRNLSAGPSSLGHFYSNESMLTFEGQQVMGAAAIIGKFTSMGKMNHEVKSIDVQPTKDPQARLIFVTGMISIDGNNPLHFCENFHLVSNGPGVHIIQNEVFRLNYG